MSVWGGSAESPAELLEADDWPSKRTALQSLAAAGAASREHAAAIALRLEDQEPQIRRLAASTLGKVCGRTTAKSKADSAGTAPVMKALCSALKDRDDQVRAEAAKAIGVIAPVGAGQHSQSLAALCCDPSADVGLAAVGSLATLEQAELLGEFVSWPKGAAVRRAAVVALGRSPQALLQHRGAVAVALADSDATVRAAAVQATAELGDQVQEAHLQALVGMRDSEKQVKVRRAAVQALGKLGSAGAEALLEFLCDQDEGIRHLAAETLGTVATEEAAEAAEALLGAIDTSVREAAALSLGKMGEVGRPHSAGLIACLQDDELSVRLSAIQALGELQVEDAAASLAELGATDAKGVRLAAVSALAKMGHPGASKLTSFFGDADQAVRAAAVKAFNPLHSKLHCDIARKFLEFVAECVQDQDFRVRFEAARALGDHRAAEFAPQVSKLAEDKDPQVRRTAVIALEKMGADGGACLHLFASDTDDGVRNELSRAARSLGVTIE